MSQQIIHQLSKMKHSPVRNYVIPGLTSWLVGNPSAEGTVRLFHNERNHQEQITPHSHRFDLTCHVLRGKVTNKLWVPNEKNGDWFQVQTLKYWGTVGHYDMKPDHLNKYAMVEQSYREGDVYSMDADQIHSIQFGKDTVVLFFEGPSITDETKILLPHVDGETIPTFKVEDWMFKKEKK